MIYANPPISNKLYSGISGSIGASYIIKENTILKLNLARGFRAPNITELSANGVHEGTFRYIIGNVNLNPEASLQVDAGLIMNTEHVSFEANLFDNSIREFIFLHKLSSTGGGDSLVVNDEGNFEVFTYSQGSANLAGGELMIDIHPHPLDWLHFENSFAYVMAVQQDATDSTRYLPFTPAPKWSSDLRADFKKTGKALSNTYFQVGVDYYFAQNNVFSAYGTETVSPGYTLINLGAGADFVPKDKLAFSVYLSINNLTDAAYQSHLSRLKNAAENYASGRIGIYNMGRNISVKLVVPFTVK